MKHPIFILTLLTALWLPTPAANWEYIRSHDPKWHGAAAITVGWKGEVTAYKWRKEKYVVMWKRS